MKTKTVSYIEVIGLTRWKALVKEVYPGMDESEFQEVIGYGWRFTPEGDVWPVAEFSITDGTGTVRVEN